MATRRSATEIDQALGQRIRAIRLRLGISQQRLAEATGVSFQQLQKYERGADRLSVSRMCAIAAALDFQPQTLLEGLVSVGRSERDLFEDQLSTPEGADLLRAFRAVRNAKLRRRIVSMVKAMGEES